MKLTLDHTQRLNLHALLGAQRADVGSIRAIWAVQDKLALDAEEEKSLELKRELVNGQERTVWNSSLFVPRREFEFTDTEAVRIKAARTELSIQTKGPVFRITVVFKVEGRPSTEMIHYAKLDALTHWRGH